MPAFFPIVSDISSTHPTLHRVGEVEHEVRWLPSEADMLFGNITNTTNDGSGGVAVDGGTNISMAFFGVPPGSCYWEVTAVWEVIPAEVLSTNVKGAMVQTMRVAPSRNKLNDVLQAIGDLTAWATSPKVVAGFMGGVKIANNMVKYGAAMGALL